MGERTPTSTADGVAAVTLPHLQERSGAHGEVHAASSAPLNWLTECERIVKDDVVPQEVQTGGKARRCDSELNMNPVLDVIKNQMSRKAPGGTVRDIGSGKSAPAALAPENENRSNSKPSKPGLQEDSDMRQVHNNEHSSDKGRLHVPEAPVETARKTLVLSESGVPGRASLMKGDSEAITAVCRMSSQDCVKVKLQMDRLVKQVNLIPNQPVGWPQVPRKAQ